MAPVLYKYIWCKRSNWQFFSEVTRRCSSKWHTLTSTRNIYHINKNNRWTSWPRALYEYTVVAWRSAITINSKSVFLLKSSKYSWNHMKYWGLLQYKISYLNSYETKMSGKLFQPWHLYQLSNSYETRINITAILSYSVQNFEAIKKARNKLWTSAI